MTDKEMIEERCKAEGYDIIEWVDTDDGLTAKLGKFEAEEDDDDGYFYEGDKGELSACVVGAEQYNNRAVSFSFVIEGNDEGMSVESLYALIPIL